MFFIQYIKYITFIDKHALVVKQIKTSFNSTSFCN